MHTFSDLCIHTRDNSIKKFRILYFYEQKQQRTNKQCKPKNIAKSHIHRAKIDEEKVDES